MNHHSFAPSALLHDPRPSEKEIFVKIPLLPHDGRTGGRQHG